jgi:hypothetical protein
MFFQNSVIKKYLAALNAEQVTAAWEVYFAQYKAALNEISAQISATDKEIDERVYALYGLTQEEIAIIEP